MYDDQIKEYGFIPMNHSKPNFVQAVVRPLMVQADEKAKPMAVEDYIAILNADEGKVLAVHGAGYNFIDNNELFEEFDDKIGGLSDNILVHSDSSHNGCRVFREYVFEDQKVEFDGSPVAPRIVMFNSYDGSMAFTGMCGLYRFVCANTAVLGRDFARKRMVHRGKQDYKAIIAELVEAVKVNLDVMPAHFERLASVIEKELPAAAPHEMAKLIDGKKAGAEFELTLRRAFDYDMPQTFGTALNVLSSWTSYGGDVVDGLNPKLLFPNTPMERVEPLPLSQSLERQRAVLPVLEYIEGLAD